MRRWQYRLAAAAAFVATALALRSPAPLRFTPGGRFKVALFADLHYGENAWTEWGPAQDAASDRVMATVLDAEKPDFVVYLGDLVTANNVPVPNQTLYLDRAISPSRSRGIPWSTVFGNHDDMPFEWPSEWFSPAGALPACGVHANLGFRGTLRIELMTAELNRDSADGLSRSSVGPQELWPGVSNYVLPVISHEKQQDPALLMYFLDSGGGTYPEIISSAQVRWFHSQSHCLNPDGRIPELIFWHIQSIAYGKVAPKAKTEISNPCVGSLNEEDVAPQEAEWGMMDALAKRSSVKAIFVGHNHGLDWCCPYEKLWLCFARHTGHGGYGDWPRGARIVEVAEETFLHPLMDTDGEWNVTQQYYVVLSLFQIIDEEFVVENLPMENPDPQFFGIEDNTNLKCHHGKLLERMVAFDMAATGSRFLANEQKYSKKLSFYVILSLGSVSVAVTLATVALMFFGIIGLLGG